MSDEVPRRGPKWKSYMRRHAGRGRRTDLKSVRCLGYGDEHWFRTRDPAGHRICCRCRVRQEEVVQESGKPRVGTIGEGDS